MKFGLMFFASSEDALVGDKYSLVIESAKFGDRHGFSTIWTPERHFTKFGSLYPNPAVLNAALARETQQIRLQAGSVVLPLHNPVRIAEEWAIVDNLSAGRVGISFAPGWNPNDFALFPEKYPNRQQEMFNGVEIIRKLWRGESIFIPNGNGEQVELRIYPTPIQPELPIWITAASNPQTFIKAGEIGANLLTHLFDQDVEQLAEKIKLYRQARAKYNHDSQSGIVSVTLHTFVGENFQAVREQARVPYCQYLKSNVNLLKGLAQSRGVSIDISNLSEKDLDDFANLLFEKFASARGLIGTPQTCIDLLQQLEHIGVDEVNCLLDFGINKNTILANLPYLNQLREINVNNTSEKVSLNGIVTSATKVFSQNNQLISSTGKTLTEIRTRCTNHKSAKEYYTILQNQGFLLGETCQSIENLWLGSKEVLAEVKYAPTQTKFNDSHKVYPALLEACHQILWATLWEEMLSHHRGSPYLPVGIKSFQIYEPMSNHVWSHAILSETSNIEQTIIGDVRIFNQEGKLLVEVSGLQMQRAKQQPYQNPILDQYGDWFYELQWRLQNPVKIDTFLVRDPGSWIIFGDRLGIGDNLAKLLEAQGQKCFVVHHSQEEAIFTSGKNHLDPANPESMQKLINQILATEKSPCRGVVHLWSLDTTPTEETTISSLEQDWTLVLTSTLHLVQSLLKTNFSEMPLVWLVTQSAQTLGLEKVLPAIAQSPAWGLGRSLAMETPHLWGGLIDIDSTFSPSDAAKALFEQIWHHDEESQIALRGNNKYVARLVPSQKTKISTESIVVYPEATYLITGGLGHLGLNSARWLVNKGARHIVLVGRRDASDTVQEAITQLENHGTQVLVMKADVSVRKDVETVLEKIQAYCPPLRGIFHTAGVEGFSPIQDVTPELIQSVVSPKILGTWNLHQITLGMELDFFVCTSSITSVWGSEGLASYAAASQFLDIFAYYRQSLNLPAFTVNIGALAGGGMHYRDQGRTLMRDLVARIGLKYYAPDDLLKTIGYWLERGVPQQVIIDMDWSIFKQLYEARQRRTLLQEIKLQPSQPKIPQLGQTQELLKQLRNASASKSYHLLVDYLQASVTKVLKLKQEQPPNPEQSLTEMG
ncbi:MAG TPA: MupA/Atu3671 family FMN-dependent luciferase-like monooxygenase, partial [Nostocaceae cyanobacterium]|nr:MupA/Atu3671 family FMN-dependent luciferase-like monooxygenase [Nostocaceae cyanobacterium]